MTHDTDTSVQDGLEAIEPGGCAPPVYAPKIVQDDPGDSCTCPRCQRPGCDGTHKVNTAGERLIKSALQAAGIARDLPMPKYWYQPMNHGVGSWPAVQPEERIPGERR